MKTPLWSVLVATWVATCGAGVAAQKDDAPVLEVTIPFTAQLAAADLKIERVTASLLGERARFTVHYASGRDRFMSFFDPPRGNTVAVMDRGALKPGATTASIEVPLEKLRRVAAITIKFGVMGENADTNAVFLNIGAPAARPFFGERIGGSSGMARARGGSVAQVADYADIRWKDASSVAALDAGRIGGLTYNEATRWPAPAAEISRAILKKGMEPGLGVKSLHRAGLTGAGVSVGIIDQNLLLDHPEFAGRIAKYHDVGCNTSGGSMHAPAVVSLLAGKNTGTAPGARVYFAAAPSWTKDAKFYADALNWLLDANAALPAADKIRVVSVSAAPSGNGSPFTKNNELWDKACARADEAGVLILDCTSHRGVIGSCYYDPAAPDDLARVQPGYPGKEFKGRGDRVLAPTSRRTVAEEYEKGECSYQYDGVGGLSWAIPYAAGVLALGWEVNPQLSGAKMVELLRASAHVNNGVKIINPVAFVEAVKKTRS